MDKIKHFFFFPFLLEWTKQRNYNVCRNLKLHYNDPSYILTLCTKYSSENPESQKKITWQIKLFLKVNLLSLESPNRYLPEVVLAQKLDSDSRKARNSNKIVL